MNKLAINEYDSISSVAPIPQSVSELLTLGLITDIILVIGLCLLSLCGLALLQEVRKIKKSLE